MYSSLEGIVNHKGNGWIDLRVGDVGYKVFVAQGLLSRLIVGEKRMMPVHVVFSEDDTRIFGFSSWEELELFELLISVSGVGPKTAVGIVGVHPVGEIKKAIGSAQVTFFEKIKGIGKKTAQRIIVDLQSKVGGEGELVFDENNEEQNDLVESLKQLGFEKKEIERVVGKIPAHVVGLEAQLSWSLRSIKS